MKSTFALFLLTASLAATATPVEFETDGAHVVVLRPVDSWSPDTSVSEATLEAVKNHQASFLATLAKSESGKPVYADGSLGGIFGSVSQNPFVLKVNAALNAKQFQLIRYGKPSIKIAEPVEVAPADMPSVIGNQARLFSEYTIAQGNPADLQSKVSAKKFFGVALALGTMAVGVDKFGLSTGINTTLGSGISDDFYRIAASVGPAMIPAQSLNIDFLKFKSVDIRKVTGSADRVGQILIAYKGEKTADIETDALVKAIVVATGADTTSDSIEKARAEDYAARLAIWNACVAEARPECKSQ